ncbi:CfrBI family restriction endonuclease [Helicobacter sp. 11S03491-1]|uniref:CfrBI family restriction endonuclease n=1 Tax=Helicobacter sp. 11S03491-1 TaxID=1476196 RepID=UPI000BA5F5B9|nr:CfrBI family restriction endonuclease [Helicobacter sp. 11S03491-1]PAF43432.1 restriction endonuclease [Helicobacter sp. 11S03491-1]
MTFTNQVIKNIVKRVIKGQDYRIEVVNLINTDFLQFVIDFFKKIIKVKLENKDVVNWYKKEFLKNTLPPDEIALHAGLNMKTIHNMYGSSAKEIVIDAAYEHYDSLYEAISGFIDNNEDLTLMLTLKFNGVCVDLTINETLLVINTLAVKRAALRGGAWSAVGKTAEKILMKTICELYKIPTNNYEEKFVRDSAKKVSREVDFYLKDNEGKKYLCEVKLMGRGNPESADVIFARKSHIFIADTLSQQNKNQSDELGVVWVELRVANSYRRIKKAFDKYGIPYVDYDGGNLDKDLDMILNKIME